MEELSLHKIYRVTFLKYSSLLKNRVSKTGSPKIFYNIETNEHISANECFLKLPEDNKPFLVAEKDLDYYRQYGDGYFSIEYVGSMYLPLVNSGMKGDN